MTDKAYAKRGPANAAHRAKKAFLLLLGCLLAGASLAACAKDYKSFDEASRDGARLPSGTVIDGIPLGGMPLEEARERLSAQHMLWEEETRFEILAGETPLSIGADTLPFTWDTEAVLLQALSQPLLGGEKTFSCRAALRGEACRAALSALAAPLSTQAQNASFSYADGAFHYTPESSGQRLDVALLARTMAALPLGKTHRLEAVMRETSPAYTLEEAKADTALLSEFSTSFAAGNYDAPGRVHNIRKAAALIDGVSLQPGEVFNMNALLGPRSRETGWREANAIRDGAYTQEYGGGVCQVSSTLYNAVLMADMEVLERAHHSWPLGYVDIGRDATISTGGPNFRFRNTGQGTLYISALADAEEKTITVRLYGRAPEGGGYIRLRSRKVETLADPGDEIREDSTLAPGTQERVRESRAGSVSETYKQYYNAGGELLREELVSRDTYKPIRGILLVAES